MAEGFKLTPEQFVACLEGENTNLQIIYNPDLVLIRRWQAILPNMGYSNIEGTGGTLQEAVNNLAAAWVNYRRKRAGDAFKEAHRFEEWADELDKKLRAASGEAAFNEMVEKGSL